MSNKIFAILTDIHSNVASLKKAISIIKNRPHVDKIICLGDCFALGSNPIETLEILQSLENCVFIRGNHDRYILDRLWDQETPSLEGMDPYDPICKEIVANTKWTYEQIGTQGLGFIINMHISHREVINDTMIEFTHAWYQRDEVPPTIEEAVNWKDHAKLIHKDLNNFIFVHGHIHIPRFDEAENLKVLCQGATGLPFDEDQRGSVAFLTVGDTFNWEIVRYDYDYLSVIQSFEDVKPPFYKHLKNTLRYASIRNDI